MSTLLGATDDKQVATQKQGAKEALLEKALEEVQAKLVTLQQQTEIFFALKPVHMHVLENVPLSASSVSNERSKQITWAAVEVLAQAKVEPAEQKTLLRKKITQLFTKDEHFDAIVALRKDTASRQSWVDFVAETVKLYQEILLEDDSCDEEIHIKIATWFDTCTKAAEQVHKSLLDPEAEERKLKDERQRLAVDKLEAEVRQRKEAERLQVLDAGKGTLLKQQEMEVQAARAEQEKQERERETETAMKCQKEQEDAQKKAEEEALKRGAAEKAKAEQERIKASWISKLDPLTNNIYYTNTVTQATSQTAPKAYRLEGAALKANQEAVRLADSKKRAAEAALREAKEVESLLNHVASGEQDEAEVLLKTNPTLGLYKGTVMDLSKRTFEGITAFQYAVWALDWRMWKMLFKYIKPEAAAMQFQELKDKGTAHGKHFSLSPLIKALNIYAKNFDSWHQAKNWSAMECDWHYQVGALQLLLPAHVAQEYCHEDRSYLPCPEFKDEKRSQSLLTDDKYKSWYACQVWSGRIKGMNTSKWSGLGRDYAYVRGDLNCAFSLLGRLLEKETSENYSTFAHGAYTRMKMYCTLDANALQNLWKIRQLQLNQLETELSKPKTSK